MPWVKKSGAPDFVNDLDVLAAQPTGGVNSWLQKFTPFFTSYQIDVNQLCSAGPPECQPVTNADFSSISPSVIWTAINAALLTPKLDCFARQMAFSTLCEFSGPGDGWGPIEWMELDYHGAPNSGFLYGHPTTVGYAGTTATRTYIRAIDPDGTGNIYDSVGGSMSDAQAAAYLASHGVDPAWNEKPAGPGFENAVGVNGTTHVILGVAYNGYVGDVTTDYAMPTIARPDAAIDPPAGTYPDIAALGAELDRIENKLHILLDANVGQQLAGLGALVPWSSVVALDNTTLVTLDATTVAVSLTVTTIAQDVDLDFGDPTRFHHLGWVYFGNEFGWLQPREISTSPLLVYPLPPGCDRLRVRVNGASTATLQRLMLGLPAA